MQGLTRKKDSYCASYSLYLRYLTKLESLDFKSAVLFCNVKEFLEYKWY